MSDQHESALRPGIPNEISKGTTPGTYRHNAYLAIADIFLPLFRPDVMLGHTRDAEPFFLALSPIFKKVAEDLTRIERLMLYSARQSFDLENDYWALHRFAIGKHRNNQIEEQVAIFYNSKTDFMGPATFISIFDKLKQKIEAMIKPQAYKQNFTYNVSNAYTALIMQVNTYTEEGLTSYLINKTSLFCYACIGESDFTRPLLREWFIAEGAQHIETCLGILESSVTSCNIANICVDVNTCFHIDVNTAFAMMAIIYCGFKIQDEARGPIPIPRRLGDCRQPEKNRRAYFESIKKIRQNSQFAQDLGVYGSYASDHCDPDKVE
ncbi:hypothetical protein V495_00409 [Pseudogymnoascus sp. VKM F-4514 (FW-929)]|nr:hypothetical protein V495_00409 [Pseudogymnoascus sp. VKM F-4514 (FW-929)]KFY66725.1 hypothetical protein V497_00745 [Pseudogymnoascus sp. VKM F-4516 (FW-969)]